MNWKFIEKCYKSQIFSISLEHHCFNYIFYEHENYMELAKGDYFKLKKGLRQGVTISHYLFVLCIYKLYHMIMDEVDKKEWEGMNMGKKGPRVSHMMFSDDLLLFGKVVVQ